MELALKIGKHAGTTALVVATILVPHWLVSVVAPIPGM